MKVRNFSVGDLVTTKGHGICKVLEFQNSRKVIVEFVDTGYTTTVVADALRKGAVKDHLSPTVYGVGVVGVGLICDKGVCKKEYKQWANMLRRCYDEAYHTTRPTYEGCSVSENFKYYPYFKDWCSYQVGFGNDDVKKRGFVLDKDILVKGNKVYSEDTCCFVPYEINNILVNCGSNRGELPVGVSFEPTTGKCKAYVTRGGVFTYLGLFDNQEEAFYAHKNAKETYVKSLANKWKDQIDLRVYEALVNYQVEITD